MIFLFKETNSFVFLWSNTNIIPTKTKITPTKINLEINSKFILIPLTSIATKNFSKPTLCDTKALIYAATTYITYS